MSASHVYIAGPMTGREHFNFPAFFEAAERLYALGLTVENPADNDGGDTWQEALACANSVEHPWEHYLRRDLGRMLMCDAVVVLPGWRQSRGASLETHIARALSIPLYRLGDSGFEPVCRIIGLSGYAQSGKDTAAAALAHLGYERRAFADLLREAVYRLDPRLEEIRSYAAAIDRFGYEYARSLPGVGDEIRRLLQRMGTGVGRQLLGENIWVDASMATLEDGGSYVFTDVRFPNEAAAIRAAGGEVWRVQRPGRGPVNDHPSEIALDGWDFDRVLVNDGTLDDFHHAVRSSFEAAA